MLLETAHKIGLLLVVDKSRQLSEQNSVNIADGSVEAGTRAAAGLRERQRGRKRDGDGETH